MHGVNLVRAVLTAKFSLFSPGQHEIEEILLRVVLFYYNGHCWKDFLRKGNADVSFG